MGGACCASHRGENRAAQPPTRPSPAHETSPTKLICRFFSWQAVLKVKGPHTIVPRVRKSIALLHKLLALLTSWHVTESDVMMLCRGKGISGPAGPYVKLRCPPFPVMDTFSARRIWMLRQSAGARSPCPYPALLVSRHRSGWRAHPGTCESPMRCWPLNEPVRSTRRSPRG